MSVDHPRVISQELGSPEYDNYLRILVGKRVKDIVIRPNALDTDQLDDLPLNFETILPPLPYEEESWTVGQITRDLTGTLQATLSSPAKAHVQNVWHSRLVDFLHLQRVKQLTLLTRECTWNEQPQPEHSLVIAKMARFEWEIPYIEAETKAYRLLEGTRLGPRFLGHVHEEGRVIGFLLEKVEGRFAGPEDLEKCTASLKRLHDLGVLHGDCNRYNFIVGRDNRVTLIDFETSRMNADTAEMEAEMTGLEGKLVDESKAGAGFVLEDSE